ncbi:MAG: hypothetical protein EOR00_09180 [Mesorhizobium sp.]|uniref:hypothetical protein n=1 Tax=Mesorhizobium sp. TaxID=1871066 RepID=UPI000FE55FA0|nr:hypothetical protein [Mesorhizobium sp.]RWP19269.1 MAG: hypothetical protein EOR00_09180 [Mesorhizobium sp.]
MADNISIKDGAGATVVLASKDVGAVQYPKRIAVDGTGAEVAVATSALQTTGNGTLASILAKIIAAPATEAKQDAEAVLVGTVTETAPASDTASSGLNGRLQRIAQRLTSLLPSSAHDAAIAGNPFRKAVRAVTANYTAVASGDTADAIGTTVGVPIQRPYSIPELDWSYAAASGGEVGTADIAVKAAAAAGLRNYMTWLTAENVHATVDTELVVKDGSTVIYRGFLKALGVGPLRIPFPSPLKSTAATALNVACITTGSQVYFNCGGYVAP